MVLVPSSWLRLRADLTLGARILGTDVYPPGCDSDTCDWSPFVARWLVAPRIVVEPWIAPWFSLGAWVDADALYLPDVAVGLSLALHFSAYDGGP
jgi:hypothetical protein